MERKKALPPLKVTKTRKVASTRKKGGKSHERNGSERSVADSNKPTLEKNMASQENNPTEVTLSKEAAASDGKKKKGPQKRKSKKTTLRVQVASGEGKQSLPSPGIKNDNGVSPKCKRSTRKPKEDSENRVSPKMSPVPKIITEAAPSEGPSQQASDSLDPEIEGVKQEECRSPLPPARKKGFVQEPIYLKSAPSSPTKGERNTLSVNQGQPGNKRQLIKSLSAPLRRRAGFSCNTKDEKAEGPNERRREALCSTTDMFCAERRGARIVRKKF